MTSAPWPRRASWNAGSARSPWGTSTRPPGGMGSSAASVAPSAADGVNTSVSPTSLPRPSRTTAPVAAPTAAHRTLPGATPFRPSAPRTPAAPLVLDTTIMSPRRRVSTASSSGPPAGTGSIPIAGTWAASIPRSARAASSGPACPVGRATRARGRARSVTTRAASRRASSSRSALGAAPRTHPIRPGCTAAPGAGVHIRSAPATSSSVSPVTCPVTPIGDRQPPPVPLSSARSASITIRVAGWSSSPTASIASASSARTWRASDPWPGAQATSCGGRMSSMRSTWPRRVSPATARTRASVSPRSSLASLVSTLPWSGCSSRSGRIARRKATRRGLSVPTLAPVGSVARVIPRSRQTRASRASSRGG